MNLATFAQLEDRTSLTIRAANLNQLVSLRNTGNQAPLFCFHPSGGDVGIYRKLVTRMEPSRPVMGIQSRMLSGEECEYESLDALSQAYAGLIDQYQPHGDVNLLGFSMGGFVATLVAQAINSIGRQVVFLGLIDSNPNWTATSDVSRRELYLRMEQVFTKFQSVGMLKQRPLEQVQADVATLVDTCLGDDSMTSENAMALIDEMGYLPKADNDVAFLSKFASTFLAHCHLIRAFRPPMIDCPLHLWWPSESVRTNQLGSSLWKSVAGDIVTESIVKGSHYSIMRGPTIRAVAAEIDTALENANCR